MCSSDLYQPLGYLLLLYHPLGYLLYHPLGYHPLLYRLLGYHLQAISHQLLPASLHLQLLGEATHVLHTPPVHTTLPRLHSTSYLALEDHISHHHKL